MRTSEPFHTTIWYWIQHGDWMCICPHCGREIQIPFLSWCRTSWKHHQISRSFILLVDSVLIFHLPLFVCVNVKAYTFVFFSFSFFNGKYFVEWYQTFSATGKPNEYIFPCVCWITWPCGLHLNVFTRKKRKWKSYIDSRRYHKAM